MILFKIVGHRFVVLHCILWLGLRPAYSVLPMWTSMFSNVGHILCWPHSTFVDIYMHNVVEVKASLTHVSHAEEIVQ